MLRNRGRRAGGGCNPRKTDTTSLCRSLAGGRAGQLRPVNAHVAPSASARQAHGTFASHSTCRYGVVSTELSLPANCSVASCNYRKLFQSPAASGLETLALEMAMAPASIDEFIWGCALVHYNAIRKLIQWWSLLMVML
jgi:hypothetical protein